LREAFGFVLEDQLHLALLAEHDDVLLGQRVKVNFARHALEVLHCEYCQFLTFLCKVRDGMAARTPAGRRMWLSHYGAEGVDPLVVE
jgi:hypothetical protein